MCVIMAAETMRPTREELEQAAARNPHGAGIAFVQNGYVTFRKVGPDKKAVAGIIEQALVVPMPFVVHFRITSSGETRPELSHPFPIRTKNPLALDGQSRNGVLFHNGTWRDWQKPLMMAATSTGIPVGRGPMSDTRAMAYLAALLGDSILEAIPSGNKMATLTRRDGIQLYGNGWTEYAPGLMVSNTLWVPRTRDDKEHPARFNDDDGVIGWVRSLNPTPGKGYLTEVEVAQQEKTG